MFWHKWVAMSAIGIFAWSGWLLRQLLGSIYRPATVEHHETTSLVVPVYREDPEILRRCIDSWLANDADEIILVIDQSEEAIIELAELWSQDEERIRSVIAYEPGKRHALCLGVRAARYDISVLTDSDTLWAPDFLRNLLSGFADPTVGGVGCRQNVYRAETSLWRRVADWMLDVRFLHFLPAMALQKGIPCISGRTAAYRTGAILPVLDELEFEYFFGRRCISGDDGRLTWLVLREGWRTAYQSNARAWTMFPNNFKGFVKQRVRWSRNSYRCYLRAMGRGWLWRQPVITSISVLQNLLGPFTLTIATGFLIGALIERQWWAVLVAATWLTFGRAVKGIGHLFNEPRALVYLPLITLVFIVVMIPIKFYALFTMNKQGWITRKSGQAVAEGQTVATLG